MRGEGKKKGGSRLFQIGYWGGGGLNVFIKKFRGRQQIDCEVFFNRGPLAMMGKAV